MPVEQTEEDRRYRWYLLFAGDTDISILFRYGHPHDCRELLCNYCSCIVGLVVHFNQPLVTWSNILVHRTTKSLHLSRPLAIRRAPCQLIPISSRSSSPCLLRPHPLSPLIFWHLVHCCMCGSFPLPQSEDVVSHFPSPWCNNVLDSLHACLPVRDHGRSLPRLTRINCGGDHNGWAQM